MQERLLLEHCAHARYVWNLAVEQHSHWKPGRASAPGFAEQCRQLTEARGESEWLRSGSVNVQQQALRDFWRAKSAFFKSGFGHPTWRRKHHDEGFRITDTCDVERLNRHWARVKVPKVGWVKFRLSRPDLPVAKSYRVTYRNGQWHVAFAVKPDPLPGPGTGEAIGIDRGVVITAALSDGRNLNCPQLTSRERARLRKHQRRAARAPKDSPQKAAEYAAAARIKAREAGRRKDWCEKTSTMLATEYDTIRFEKLNIVNMTASARGTTEKPGRNVAQKTGLTGPSSPKAGACSGTAPKTRLPDECKTSRPRTPACGAVPAGGSTRNRARAKPVSSVPPAASPATRTSTQQLTSRRDHAGGTTRASAERP